MELFDYDPLTGVAEYFDYEHLTGTAYIKTVQDVQPLLDRNKRVANEGGADAMIKRDNLWHYASVPMVVIMEMRQKGINFFDDNDFPRVMAEINANYPYLKLTTKNYAPRS